MILYVAAVYTTGLGFSGSYWRKLNDNEKAARKQVKHILESYHYVHSQRAVDSMRRDGVKVFLDSGAFSAFTQGVEIDLDKYCEYIKKNADIIKVASVLDGIGDPLKTYKNQHAIEKRGVQVLPCFHYGEDERYLEHYLANYEYITLGGMVPISTDQLVLWLDRIWDRYLTDKDGLPIRKVHGFGLTRQTLVARYPWFSVDSSSWVQSARTGSIVLPDMTVVAVSKESPMRHEAGRHYLTKSLLERQRIDAIVEELGFTVQRCIDEYNTRYTFNMVVYANASKEHEAPRPFHIHQDTFF